MSTPLDLNPEQIHTALTRILELEARFKELKALYGEYDLLIMMLKRAGFSEAEHEGYTFTLTHNYFKEGEETNTAYRVAFIRQYEMKIKEIKVKAAKLTEGAE